MSNNENTSARDVRRLGVGYAVEGVRQSIGDSYDGRVVKRDHWGREGVDRLRAKKE